MKRLLTGAEIAARCRWRDRKAGKLDRPAPAAELAALEASKRKSLEDLVELYAATAGLSREAAAAVLVPEGIEARVAREMGR